MFPEGISLALSGSSLVKVTLSIVFGLLCLSLRRKETEGIFTGFALYALYLLARDILYFFLPYDDLFRASDIILFALVSLVILGPRSGSPFWFSVAVSAVALVILAIRSIFTLAPGFPAEVLRAMSLAPILAVGLAGRPAESEGSPGSILLGRMRLPFMLFSFGYLLVGTVAGMSSPFFQLLAVPLFYGSFLWLGPAFSSIVEGQLIEAVDYYESSVDSLYSLLLPPGEEAGSRRFAMQESLDNMGRVLAEKVGADGAAILLVEELEAGLALRSLHGDFAPPCKLPDSLPRSEAGVSDFFRRARFRLGEGLLGETARSGQPLLIPDTALDARVPRNGEEDWLLYSSLMVLPLVVRERSIGVIALEKKSGEPFSENDFERAKLLASFGSISVANTFSFLEAAEKSDIEREAAIAEGIQKTLRPQKLPPIGGYSFGAMTVTARGVCSDYYDILRPRPDKAVIAVGDVAGKGVAAGIVMVMVSSILHLITNSTKDMATLMAWVNRGITGQVDLDHFATLGLVALDAETGSLEYSNASQEALLVYRADSDGVETVDQKSIPIGVERATPYASKTAALGPGDILLMHTDGIVEAMNEQGKQFGRKNLAEALQRNKKLPAQELAEAILAEVREFAGDTRQHDDQTVLVMKSQL
jgi:sigma-B regulation protein RsbU (phosphoserine phosphatase)